MNGLITLIIIAGSALFSALVIWSFFAARKRIYAQITRSINMKLLLVVLPRDMGGEKKSDEDLIAVMEQFFSALASAKLPKKGFFSPKSSIIFELAVPHVGENISFYVSTQAKFVSDIEKQIYSYFPKSHVTLVEDYTIFNPTGASEIASLALDKDAMLPILTYRELKTDPLKEITNALSSLREVGEGAALQILVRPAESRLKKKGLALAKKVRGGKSLSEAMKELNKGMGSRFLGAVAPPAGKKEKEEARPQSGEKGAAEALEGKASKAQLEVNIRLVASAKDQNRAEEILRQIENAFAQFAHPLWNKFEVMKPKPKNARRLFFDFSYRIFSEREKIVLSVEELAGLYHFPNTNLETPRIKTAATKTSEPPSELPKEGLLLGRNIYRGEEKQIFMTREDRRRHLYAIGQTGTGKSTLLKNMIVQDILNGEGVGLIDPHGDIAEEVLGSIPEARHNDVVFIDPSDLSRPIGLNMLQYDPKYPEQKTFIVNELINILDKLYDLRTTGGPMFEQYTRNALLLLMEYPDRGFTLLEIPKVLADKEFRKSLLANCTNILVRDFWEKEAEKAGGEAALANMVPYITSKFNVFLANDYVRPIIAQSNSSIDFREIMDSKKILIVSLAKGRLGDINASLLGLIIVGKILMASFSRVDTSEDRRKDFYLYIDEFQNFATDSIATILSEARKYRLDLTIAHQFIEQLKKEIKDAVFGNVGSMIALRVGSTDGEFLAKQFAPVFNDTDLVNVDNFNAYVKLLVNGKTTKPFSMQIIPPQKGSPTVAETVRRMSSAKYGRERALVEKEIIKRLRPEYKTDKTAPPA